MSHHILWRTEKLYYAALLELGPIPYLHEVLKFDSGEPVAWERRFARSEFMEHKRKLLHWMNQHVICDDGVWCPGSSMPHELLLTKQATYWVAGFYQWLAAQGEANAKV